MSNRYIQVTLIASAVWILTFQQAPSITADELAKALSRGQPIKLIDLRSRLRFETGSIPGAMNIPASVILEKHLPPLNPVVLFDDGLGDTNIAEIVATLNRQAGWNADALAGGFAAWHALQNTTDTAPAGLHPENIQQISYDKLDQLAEGVVLLDTRPPAARVVAKNRSDKPNGAADNSSEADPVRTFCGKKGNRSYCADLDELRKHHQSATQQQAKNNTRPSGKQAGLTPLIVLVDTANGDAREIYRRLRAEGYTRVVILTGGEESIQLEGRRGKGRVSGTIGQGSISNPPTIKTPATKP